jgi:hypothetical protein
MLEERHMVEYAKSRIVVRVHESEVVSQIVRPLNLKPIEPTQVERDKVISERDCLYRSRSLLKIIR